MKQNQTIKMVSSAMLAALVFVLGLTPLGIIPLGFINVTILCVPVIIGTLFLGLRTGLVLGGLFGLASVMSALGMSMTAPSALASALAAANPLLLVLMCMIPRLAVPTVAALVYRLLTRKKDCSVRAVPFAAAAGSLTNTVLYLGLMLLFYQMSGLDTLAVIGIIPGTALIAGSTEAAVAAIIVTPIMAAVWKKRRSERE